MYHVPQAEKIILGTEVREVEMRMLEEQYSDYDESGYEIAGVAVSQRGRKKDAEQNSRSRSKKRSHRKRGGQGAVVGISHRRLHRWS